METLDDRPRFACVLSGEVGQVLAALRVLASRSAIGDVRFRSSLNIMTCRVHLRGARAEIAPLLIELPSDVVVSVRSAECPATDAYHESLNRLALARVGRFRIGEIVPKVVRANPHSLAILPSAAFGTGHHPATQGCVRVLERFLKRGSAVDTILDFGCGSGILGLLAARRRKCGVMFVDRSKQAIQAVADNARANGLPQSMWRVRSALAEHNQYDLVLANLNAEAHRRAAASLVRAARRGGTLVIGGLREAEANSLTRLYLNQGFLKVISIWVHGWVAVQLKKRS